jgi:phosphoribosylformylglycinamidine synthase
MQRKPRVCIIRTAGTNCDKETAFAFKLVGSDAVLVHVNDLVNARDSLKDYQILALSGGFSYGDDIASGKVFANELKCKLAEDLKSFIKSGKLIIGICNGFQILVKSGLLPGNSELKQESSLIINDSGKFEDRWVYLKNSKLKSKKSKCVWTKDLPEIIYLPVAHGEGKFIVGDNKVLERLKNNGQIAFQYCDAEGKPGVYPLNPNGAVDDIAGICDETGRIFGLMPHPERHIMLAQHPRWKNAVNRKERASFSASGDGLQIFRNGVEYVKKHL